MTTRYTLTWPDGEKATAEITAANPNDLAPLQLGGQYARLVSLPRVARPTLLGSYVQHLADRDRATVEVDRTGTYADENDVR